MDLATKYRPQSFADMVGQKPVKIVLQQMVRSDDVPNALLFSGPRGTGKTTTARILGAALAASVDGDVDSDDPTARAFLDGRSSGVIELDAASNGGVDSVRELRDVVQYAPTGWWRVIILDEAHSMTREAFNALLKTLEEPPERTVFILVTTEPNKILETVRSRCMEFRFSRVAVADLVSRLEYVALEEFDPPPDEALLYYLAEQADGGVRDALKALDQAGRADITTLEQWYEFMGVEDWGPSILSCCVRGDLAGAFDTVTRALDRTGDIVGLCDQITAALRDVVVLQAGGSTHRSGGSQRLLEALAGEVSQPALVASLKALWALRGGLRQGSSVREELDLCVAVVSDACGKIQAEPTRAEPRPQDKLTLDDMRRLAA